MHHPDSRCDVLFVLKRGMTSGGASYSHRKSSGLYHSTELVSEALCEAGIRAQLVEVVDGNGVDRELAHWKPKLCIIEAIWVTPSKMLELNRLHKHVQFYVHLHSNTPFLALEGMAIEWICQYPDVGAEIIANSEQSFRALEAIVPKDSLHLLPNIYLEEPRAPHFHGHHDGQIHIGCFGAIRPMKNHLTQAIAAIEFARDKGKHLVFHINGTRVEQSGNNVLKNLRALFKATARTSLEEHPWRTAEDFKKMLPKLDLCMQVSLSETFNVVTADAVTAGVPVVTSKEIPWVAERCKARDDKVDDIVNAMHRAYESRFLVLSNQFRLKRYSNRALKLWKRFYAEET